MLMDGSLALAATRTSGFVMRSVVTGTTFLLLSPHGGLLWRLKGHHLDTGNAKQRFARFLCGDEFDTLPAPGGGDVDGIAGAQTKFTGCLERFFLQFLRDGDPADVGKKLFIEIDLILEAVIAWLWND